MPTLQVGQRLDVLVEGQRSGRLLLNVLGQRLSAQTQLTATPGERLSVQVQTLQPQITLKVIQAESPRTQTQALMAQLLPRQQPMGTAMGAIARSAAASQPQSTPTPVADALNRLVEALPTKAEATDPSRLRELFGRSGVFLERALSRAPATESGGLVNRDLKAALHRLAARLREATGRPTPSATANTRAAGAGGTGAPGATVAVLEGLFGQVESALSRIQLLQLQPTVSQAPLDLTVELPLRDGDDMDNLYVRIRREDDQGRERGSTDEGDDDAEPPYQLTIRLDFEHHGTVQATLRMQGEKVSALWHAPDPTLSRLIDAHLPELDARIRALGLEPESLLSVNAPPPPTADDIRHPPSGILSERA